jgi:hypothetical protein
VWLITYEDKDVSDDIAPMVKSVTYTDHVHGKSDEIGLTLTDDQALWRGSWYPSKGDRIDLKIGYDNEPLLPCGRFEVDTVDLDGVPDVVTVRGLAAGITAPLRTKLSRGFEEVSVRDIALQIAAEHGLQLVGEPPTRTLRRVSQASETSLGFLKRLAEEYDCAFSVRGEQLVFFRLLDLEQAAAVTTLRRTELSGYRFSDGTQGTYVACEVSYQDPESGELLKCRVEADDKRTRTSTAAASSIPPDVLGVVAAGKRRVSRGELVRTWQRWIAGLGFYAGKIDGEFGELTRRGTRQFQAQQHITVDGSVGPETYGAAITMGFVPSDGNAAQAPAAGDVLYRNIRVESGAEAEDKARALLRQANRLQVTGSLRVPGNQRLVAGSKIELVGMSRLDGAFLIDKSTHSMSRGYTTEVEVHHV